MWMLRVRTPPTSLLGAKDSYSPRCRQSWTRKMHSWTSPQDLLLRAPAPQGLGRGQGGSGHSSCSGSPMLLGSPAVGLSMALALKVCTCLGTPSTFVGREELPRGAVEEEEMGVLENDDADQAKDWTQCNVHLASTPCSACRRVEPDSRPNERTRTAIWRKDTLLKWPVRLV